jgi:uncharacterized protein YjbI with pentapeptide repeats
MFPVSAQQFYKLTPAEIPDYLRKHGIPNGASLSGVALSNVDLSGANLSGANLIGKDFTDSVLVNANLTGAFLTGALLTRANLADANLSDANLTGVTLTDANLSGANLRGVNPSGANLSGANLTNAYGVVASGNNIHFINGVVLYVLVGEWFGTLSKAVGFATGHECEPYILGFQKALKLHRHEKATPLYDFSRW